MQRRVSPALVGCGLAVVALATGCASKYKEVEEGLLQPINCATAKGDIRVLEGEKTHAAQQLAAGATFVTPAGIVIGAIRGTAGPNYDVSTGDYNRKIDERIAQIKSTCGVQ